MEFNLAGFHREATCYNRTDGLPSLASVARARDVPRLPAHATGVSALGAQRVVRAVLRSTRLDPITPAHVHMASLGPTWVLAYLHGLHLV